MYDDDLLIKKQKLDFRARKVHLSVAVNPKVWNCPERKGTRMYLTCEIPWNFVAFPYTLLYLTFLSSEGQGQPKIPKDSVFWGAGTCYGLVVLEGIMLADTHVDFV